MTTKERIDLALGKPLIVVEFNENIAYGDLEINVSLYNLPETARSNYEFGMSCLLRYLGLSKAVGLLKVVRLPIDQRSELQYVLDTTVPGLKVIDEMVLFVRALFLMNAEHYERHYVSEGLCEPMNCVPMES